jgi:hypothetical protein
MLDINAVVHQNGILQPYMRVRHIKQSSRDPNLTSKTDSSTILEINERTET